ncbi:hypothetical protein AZE42_05466 [Rhizopogon vesiculosus]|uniref:Uncharacterized protein n=1 Tax=Rhizopogon vesiculosus TaxID=180088 RepID=A0A1J8QC54_9AGAM|nr:hypothetical protein AZE42_05466 [Rhizopogon vesiculosus]
MRQLAFMLLVHTSDRPYPCCDKRLYKNPLPKDRRRSHPSQDYRADQAIGKQEAAGAIIAWSHDADAGERISGAAYELTEFLL